MRASIACYSEGPTIWRCRSFSRVLFTPALEEGQWIERYRVSPDFEIELWRADASRLAGRTDDVAALNLIASLNLKLFRVRVGGYVVVDVAHEDQIAELLQTIAGINHNAIVGRLDWGALRYGEGDAVVSVAVRLATKASYDFPMHGPVEDRSAIRGSPIG